MELDRKTVRRIIFILCFVVLFCAAIINLGKLWTGFKWLMGVLMPIIIGFAVAFIAAPPAAFFEKKLLGGGRRFKGFRPRTARVLSVTVVYVLALAVVALLIVAVIPQLRSAYYTLRDTVPGQVRDFVLWLHETAEGMGIELDVVSFGDIDWAKLTSSVGELVQRMVVPEGGVQNVFGGVIGAASSLFGAIVDLLLGLVIGFRLVVNKEAVGRFFVRFLRAYTREDTARRVTDFVGLCTGAFKSFISGQLTEAMALMLLCFIGMTVFRFPYPVAASAIMGFTALIPVFGAWIGGVIGTLLALTQSPWRALLFVAFIICLQMLDNTFVYPRIVGNSMQLPGLLVMCAVIIGGSVAGVTGMLLGVPVSSVVYTLVKRAVDTRLRAKEELQKPKPGL